MLVKDGMGNLGDLVEKHSQLKLAYDNGTIVYFYSDDYEASEVITRFGNIEPINIKSEPYEAVVNAEGYNSHISAGHIKTECFFAYRAGVWVANFLT